MGENDIHASKRAGGENAAIHETRSRNDKSQPHNSRSHLSFRGASLQSSTDSAGAVNSSSFAMEKEAAHAHRLENTGANLVNISELRRYADTLTAIAEDLRSAAFDAPSNDTAPVGNLAPTELEAVAQNALSDEGIGGDIEDRRQTFAELARETYAKRRKRTSIFGDPELFGEPGWDILLDLYIAQIEDKPVSVSSACIGSASPPTTGLRWLGVLTEQGLIQREHDPKDQRRVLVRLTEKALEAMDRYFESSVKIGFERRIARA